MPLFALDVLSYKNRTASREKQITHALTYTGTNSKITNKNQEQICFLYFTNYQFRQVDQIFSKLHKLKSLTCESTKLQYHSKIPLLYIYYLFVQIYFHNDFSCSLLSDLGSFIHIYDRFDFWSVSITLACIIFCWVNDCCSPVSDYGLIFCFRYFHTNNVQGYYWVTLLW